MEIKSYIVIVIVIVSLATCTTTPWTLEDKLEELEGTLDRVTLGELRKLEGEDVVRYEPIDSIVYKFYYTHKEDFFSSYFSSLSVSDNVEFKIYFLKLALYANIKHIRLNADSLLYVTDSLYRSHWEDIENERVANQEKSRELVILNNRNKNVGDDIDFVLPLKEKNGFKRIFYYSGYPYSLSYELADDSVAIEGIIIDKYVAENSIDDTIGLIFRCKIHDLNRDSVYLTNKLIKPNDTFDLHLLPYGRVLD